MPMSEVTVQTDEQALAAAAVDFGGVRSARPAGVVRPGTAHEVADAVRWARDRGLPVAAQGRRHSVYGRSQVPGGLVVDMSGLDTVRLGSAGHVVVEAGATWRQVLDVTLPAGLAPPVLPDYLDISVGGTLCVGGVGAATPWHGFVTDHVLELHVVTGTGDMIRCSPAERPELFDAVRAGLGQAAVIVSATLALSAAPSVVRTTTAEYDELGAMLADARRLVSDDGRADAVQGAITPRATGGRGYLLEVSLFDAHEQLDHPVPTSSAETTYLAFLDRLSALEAVARARGQWTLPHPWLMTFVGDSVVEQQVSEELRHLGPEDLGELGRVSVNPIRPGVVGTPLVRLPAEPLCFTLNLVRMPTRGDAQQVERLVADNRAAHERVRAAGGTTYPVSALPMTSADWRAHLGETYDDLAGVRRELGSGVLLTPGYEVFAGE